MKTIATILTILAIGFQGFSAKLSHAETNERPNIMVFLVDDMGLMDTSLPFLTDSDGNAKRYPLNDYYRTPSMERLATQGIRFEQFDAMSVGSPTRVWIMTGQNAARHRTTNWINPSNNNAGKFGAPDWNWTGLNGSDVTLPKIPTSGGLIQFDSGHYQLFNLAEDPFEQTNRAETEPAILGRMMNELIAQLETYQAIYCVDKSGKELRPQLP